MKILNNHQYSHKNDVILMPIIIILFYLRAKLYGTFIEKAAA
jgi:hypothetical protein